jgi:hypothetical protein
MRAAMIGAGRASGDSGCVSGNGLVGGVRTAGGNGSGGSGRGGTSGGRGRRGEGRASFQRMKERLLRQAHPFEEVDIARIRVKGVEQVFPLYVFHTPRPLLERLFQPLEGMIAVAHERVLSGHLIG